jgi:hypothetical protein
VRTELRLVLNSRAEDCSDADVDVDDGKDGEGGCLSFCTALYSLQKCPNVFLG